MAPRGGDRGGRKPKLPEDQKRQTLNCRVAKSTLDWLTAKRDESGSSIGELVDSAVETLSNQLKSE